METRFNALLVPAECASAAIQQIGQDDLPPGDVTIRVRYSSLNYKDGLAVTGKGKILRRFPAVPGIDLAGEVTESSAPDIRIGENVLATGCGLGEVHWGGYAQYARLPAAWVVPLPEGIDLKRAMAIGTAGFTAMLSVMALEEGGVNPHSGEILVTGASGGVGSVAIMLLSKLGYNVAASTGRPEGADCLQRLGASSIVDRKGLESRTRPLESAQWAAAIDSVGGATLAHLLSKIKTWGVVASCGLAGGSELNTTVMPFILRGITLRGIHSVETLRGPRLEAWRRLGRDIDLHLLDEATHVARLSDIDTLARDILVGHIRGRAVIDVDR
jgi:acrylyl-CoA reductase (NADPH)